MPEHLLKRLRIIEVESEEEKENSLLAPERYQGVLNVGEA